MESHQPYTPSIQFTFIGPDNMGIDPRFVMPLSSSLQFLPLTNEQKLIPDEP